MFDIERILNEYGLTSENYEQLLDDCAKKLNKEIDLDWGEICDKYSIPWNPDSLRKSQASFAGGAFVKQYMEEKYVKGVNELSNDDYIIKLDEKKRELERERIKFRDMKNAWQKQNYANARAETTLDILEEKLSNISRVEFPKQDIMVTGDKEKEAIVILSDLHIGGTHDSSFGKFNSDIAKDRLNQYLRKIIKECKMHNCWKIHVACLGDILSNFIHLTLQVTNKENLIEQIKLSTELIASFCYELSKEFEVVQFSICAGNHDRAIAKKEDAIHDERFTELTEWVIEILMKDVDNFHVMKHRKLDVGIIDLSVCGKTYIGVHGDYDSLTDKGISSLCLFLGFTPEAILKGHMHYPAYTEYNGVKMIQSGSLSGCGDQYTVEKRLGGKPSQTFMICDSSGIDCIYNVELD